MKSIPHSLDRMRFRPTARFLQDATLVWVQLHRVDTNPASLNPVGTATPNRYNVGQGMVTATAERPWMDGADSSTRWHSRLRKSP